MILRSACISILTRDENKKRRLFWHVVCVPGCRLRVEVQLNSTRQWLWAEYDNMTVESENNRYRLHVAGHHGNAGDALNDDRMVSGKANGMQFSTLDSDNDLWSGGACTAFWQSGWWHRMCSTSTLNGRLRSWYTPTPTGMMTMVSASRMMLQCGEH